MRRCIGLVVLGALGACGRIDFDPMARADGGNTDRADAPALRCNRAQPFGTPVPLSVLSSSSDEIGVELTDDELDGLMWSNRSGVDQLYETTRASAAASFGAPATLPTLGSGTFADRDPCPSGDGLTVVFSSQRPGAGDWDLWMATRPNRQTAFGAPMAVTSLNTANANWGAYLTSSGLGLYYVEGEDLQVAHRANTATMTFSAPTVLSELNTTDAEFEPTVTPDELTILFASSRPGGQGGLDIWMATRATTTDVFSAPTNLSELNTSGDDIPSWISPDLCEMYLTRSTAAAGWDLFVAKRP